MTNRCKNITLATTSLRPETNLVGRDVVVLHNTLSKGDYSTFGEQKIPAYPSGVAQSKRAFCLSGPWDLFCFYCSTRKHSSRMHTARLLIEMEGWGVPSSAILVGGGAVLCIPWRRGCSPLPKDDTLRGQHPLLRMAPPLALLTGVKTLSCPKLRLRAVNMHSPII